MNLACRIYLLVLTAAALSLLSGCATAPSGFDDKRLSLGQKDAWITSILNYEASLPADHPDHINNAFEVDPSIRDLVREKFSQYDNKHRRAKELAHWLVGSDGHDMQYKLEANFTPNQAFRRKQGNCLSFTILLVSLANDLGVELEYNDVRLPSIWNQDEQTGLVFYRHVNAVYKSPRQTQVFDLAIEEYDAAYPQTTISRRSAGAMLHSNLGISALKQQDIKQAVHHLKLAIAIDPNTSYLWTNLGVAYKRYGQFDMAEKLFRVALKLKDFNSLAASNLERLYRTQGRNSLANRYQKMAARARANNPYVQYDNAQKLYQNQQFKQARKAVKRAISLHDTDPRFFELSSAINQQLQRNKHALLDLEKAFNLANSTEDRGRYFNKVKLVAKRIEKEAQERKERKRRTPTIVDGRLTY